MKRYRSGLKAAAAQQAAQPSGLRMDVIAPDGTVGTIDAGEAEDSLGFGYQLATPESLQKNAERKQYGEGIANELEAGALGILRGASFGLSDLALRAINPGWADTAAKLKEHNPDASLAGELGSFALPLLGQIKGAGLLGEAAKGTGILQGLVSRGGEALGDVAKKIIGDNLAGTVAKGAVNMAAQSAVYQAAHNISEDALQDKEYTAESILAHTGDAAILGAGLGAAIPLVARGTQAIVNSSPVRYVASAAMKQAEKFLDRERNWQLFSGAGAKEFGPAGEKWANNVNMLGHEGLYQKGEVALDPKKFQIVKVAEGGIPGQGDMLMRLGKISDQLEQARNTAYDAIDSALSKDKISVLDPDWRIGSIREAKAVHKEIAAMRDALTTFSEADMSKINATINGLKKTSPLVDTENLRGIVDSYKEALKQAGSANAVRDIATQLGKDIELAKRGAFTGAVELSPRIEVLMDIRKALRNNLNFVGERLQELPAYRGAIAEMAPISRLNKLTSAVIDVQGTLQKAVARAESNVNVGGLRFRDIGIGAVAGGVLGGPAGIVLAFANKALQTDKGLLFRAAIGEKIQKLAWAEQLTQKSQAQISNSIKGFLGSADAAKIASKALDRIAGPIVFASTDRAFPQERLGAQQEWFNKTKKEILRVASSPDDFAAHQGEQIQGLAADAPQLADALLVKQQQIYSYLAQAMPKNPAIPLSANNDNWKPADYQIQKFRKLVQVARSPLTLLSELGRGTATQDQVAAVKSLYPKLYDRILSEVQTQINEPGTKVEYAQQLKLNQLFPGANPRISPALTAAMQNPAGKPQGPAKSHSAAKTDFSSRRRSAAERLEAPE